MEINLRKASAIQNSINDEVKKIKFEHSVSLNEFQSPTEVLESHRKEFLDSIVRRDLLLDALYSIRDLVSNENAKNQINERLTNVAFIEKQIQFYSELSGHTVREDNSVINGKLEKIKNSKDESRLYARYDTVNTSVLLKSDIEGFKVRVSHLKKLKQKIQDEILEINVRAKIKLPDTVANVLTVEGLV